MCGITGWFNTSAKRSSTLLAAMAQSIKHRGPDATGVKVFCNRAESETGEVGLGHVRLSVIDLSDNGRQPMCDTGKKYWIVFNGEIYNFKTLRKELIDNFGVSFASSTDTEVLLQAYIAYGEKCVEMCNGMFAFAIYDSVKEQLFCARDRLGVKPLYVYSAQGEFVFASEMRPLYRYLRNKVTVDKNAMYEFLVRGYIGGNKSIAQGVTQVPPATCITVDKTGGITRKTYWELGSRAIKEMETPPAFDSDKIISQVEQALAASVASRLVSDVPLGVFLSGGIDSTLIACLAQKASNKRVKTFTIGFTEKEYDESGYAREVARALGTEHHEFIISEQEFLSALDTFHAAFDEPFADESAIPTIVLSRFSRQHITVALSGDGGDEEYFGYTTYDYLSKLAALYKVPRAVRRLGNALVPRSLVDFDLATKLQALQYRDVKQARANIANPFSVMPSLLQSARLPLPEQDVFGALAPQNRWMLQDLTGYMTEDILVKVDRASMHFGLEVRNPFLDYRFVEESFYTVPLALKTGRGKKHVLKTIASRHVPARLIDRPKMGFAIPIAKWVNGELNREIGELLGQKTMLDTCINRDRCRSLLTTPSFARTKYGSFLLWRIYSFMKWEQRQGLELS
jgi:asparagine synthase (glutamine-hydrolysing)